MKGSVVSLAERREKKEAENVFVDHGYMITRTRELYSVGGIERPGYTLAMQVIAAAFIQKTREVVMRPNDAFIARVRYENTYLAGPLFGPLTRKITWIHAAQQCHVYAGIWNHFNGDELDKPDIHAHHFTSDVRPQAWGMDTPILFRLPRMTAEMYAAAMDHSVSRVLAGATTHYQLDEETDAPQC